MKALVAALTLVVVFLGVVSLTLWKRTRQPGAKLDTAYEAVLLDNGQVYYGKIEGVGTAFPVLRDVYYVQQQVNQQTKEVSNILIRRGNEWHAPDRMVLNARHIVLIEPVSPSSKVAHLISDLTSQQRATKSSQ